MAAGPRAAAGTLRVDIAPYGVGSGRRTRRRVTSMTAWQWGSHDLRQALGRSRHSRAPHDVSVTDPAQSVLNRPPLRPLVRGAGAAVAVPLKYLLQRLGRETAFYRRVLQREPSQQWFRRDGFAGYEPDERDVIVATYLKSGTNWMLQIASQVAWRGGGDFSHIHEFVPWPDAPRYGAVDLRDAPAATPTGLRVIKTHLPVADVPVRPHARYLSVIRDPKDVVVSSWHFFHGFVAGPLMPSVAAWLDLFCSPDFPFGSWAEHVAGWWDLRHEPNVGVFTFVDLVDGLPAGVDRVAELLDVALTPAERDTVVDRSRFATMRAMDERFRPPTVSPFAYAGSWMMRRGAYGIARELLSAAQCRRIDRWCSDELARLGSDLPYDRVAGAP